MSKLKLAPLRWTAPVEPAITTAIPEDRYPRVGFGRRRHPTRNPFGRPAYRELELQRAAQRVADMAAQRAKAERERDKPRRTGQR